MKKFKLSGLQTSTLVIVIASLIIYFTFKQIPQETIQGFLQKFGPWTPLMYILLHQISYVFAPISGFPFLLVGYSLFGEKVVIYSYLVVLLGSAINFGLAKKWGRPLVSKMVGEKPIKKIDELTKTYGLTLLIALRVLHGGISDYVSYAYGLTNMKFSTFYITSALATIPGQLIWYYVAVKSESIEQFILLSLGLSVIATGIFLAFNYFLRKNRK